MWHSNPLVRGTYSYLSVDAAEKGIVPGSLSYAATTGRLRFAGEATHPHRWSTVHGAMETGWWEADKIIQEEGL